MTLIPLLYIPAGVWPPAETDNFQSLFKQEIFLNSRQLTIQT